MKLRTLRIISQVFFLALFTILFAVNSYPHAYTIDSEWMLRLNPLVALIVQVASRTVIPLLIIYGGVLILFTLIFGRMFCGWICPLGTLVDATDSMVFFSKKKLVVPISSSLQKLKYLGLFVTIIAALLGVTLVLFLDPLSIATRFLTLIGYPAIKIFGGALVTAFGPLAGAIGIDSLSLPHVKQLFFYGIGTTILLGVVVFGGGLVSKRFWCQYLCPTGAFFGLLSRAPLFRRGVISMACNECSRCRKVCPTHAIDQKNIALTNSAECIVCGNCTSLKEVSCSRFQFGFSKTAQVTGADITRRTVFGSILASIALLPLFKANGMTKRDNTGRLMRPPGAIPENLFMAKCIGCTECIKVCPTNALHPSVGSDGVNRLYTPKLVPRIGGCEEKCTLCGNVCPTGALRNISLDDKQFAKIGTAVIDRHKCLAWEQNKECVVCDEVCPYNAIEIRVVETTKGLFKVPIVWEDLCMGCGMCEQQCPIADEAAIVVYKFGEIRKARGPYVNEWQRQAILDKRNSSDAHNAGQQQSSGFSSEGSPLELLNKGTAKTVHQKQSLEKSPPSSNGLPPGFTN